MPEENHTPKSVFESVIYPYTCRFGSFPPSFGRLSELANSLDIQTVGIENLQRVEKPFICVANHSACKTFMGYNVGIPPDAFILSRLIKEITGKNLSIIAMTNMNLCILPRSLTSPFMRYCLSKIPQILPMHVSNGPAGLKELADSAKSIVEAGMPLLIFPSGKVHAGEFDTDCTFFHGASYISIILSLPILPTCLVNARSWDLADGPILVAFGEPLNPIDIINQTGNPSLARRQKRALITREIKTAIGELYTRYGVTFTEHL
jgi:1-acyl-sn-glycerol-3-phosphate acyltransferase